MKYLVIIDRIKDRYLAYCPDLLGCITVSDTLEQSEKDIRKAMISYLRWFEKTDTEQDNVYPPSISISKYIDIDPTSDEFFEDTKVNLVSNIRTGMSGSTLVLYPPKSKPEATKKGSTDSGDGVVNLRPKQVSKKITVDPASSSKESLAQKSESPVPSVTTQSPATVDVPSPSIKEKPIESDDLAAELNAESETSDLVTEPSSPVAKEQSPRSAEKLESIDLSLEPIEKRQSE